MEPSGPVIPAVAAGVGWCGSTKPTDPISGTWRRGALLGAGDAPAEGKRFEEVLRLRNLVVEQILTGRTAEPRAYVQEQDEWVLVLGGTGVVDVEGRRMTLGPGEWLFLPSGVAHTVVEADVGTTWLAVHLH